MAAIILLSRVWEINSLGDMIGDGLSLLNAVLFAALTVFNRKFVQSRNPQLVTTWMFLGAALWSFSLLVTGFVSVNLDFHQLELILLMVLLPTFASYTLMKWGMKGIKASTSGIILLITPVTTTLLSYPILGEVLGNPETLGAALVLVAILILRD